MNWRDEIAEEMGYTICPLSPYTYVSCDEECETCNLYLDFKEGVENGNSSNQ